MKRFLLAVISLVLFFINTNFAQQTFAEKVYEFKGVIKDQNSDVLAGTSLFFRSNNKSVSVTTSADGEFIAYLSPETYEITVGKDISDSFTAFIKINENIINPNNVEFIIKTNAICCGQSTGIMYPKLLSFPKPGYPPAARAVRATGEVIVVVKIDREGKVLMAKAESGHPLLRTVSEKAAKNSRFDPSENISEREAKLTYVFLNDGGDQNLKHYSNEYRTEIISW